MNPFTLVIIEDEESHFSLMKRAVLKHLPDTLVNHFKEAGACLEKLDEISPDLIVTDYVMPGMNGIELLEILKQKKVDIPVIMITGQGDENIAVRAMKLGAWDYLVKSVDFFALLPRVIEKVVRERRLEESLREYEARFKDLAEMTSEWIVEIDVKGRCTYCNPAVQDILGYRPDQMVGRNFYDFFPEAVREELKHSVFIMLAQRKPLTFFELRLIHKDGRTVFVETNFVPFFDKTGGLLGYRGIHRDVTARKHAEEALRESEEKFRSIFEKSPIGIELYDPEGQILDANQSCLDIFGVTELAALEGFKLFDSPAIPHKAKARLSKGEILRYETPFDLEQIKRLGLYNTIKSGIIHLEIVITQLGLSGKGSFSGYLIQIRDISKRRKAQELARRLSQQLMKAQEIERQRLARDLHDHLAQDLSTLKIGLDTLCENYSDIPLKMREKVSGLSKIVQGNIKAVRDLAYYLCPAILDQLGLVQTIRHHCERFSEKNRVKVDFFSAGMDSAPLDFDTEINLYRITQEALNNIKKHANATNVAIKLVASYPSIILRIEDNGKGFNIQDQLEAALTERRMGIRSMEERVALLNGKFKIRTAPLQGTKILIEIPYTEANIG